MRSVLQDRRPALLSSWRRSTSPHRPRWRLLQPHPESSGQEDGRTASAPAIWWTESERGWERTGRLWLWVKNCKTQKHARRTERALSDANRREEHNTSAIWVFHLPCHHSLLLVFQWKFAQRKCQIASDAEDWRDGMNFTDTSDQKNTVSISFSALTADSDCIIGYCGALEGVVFSALFAKRQYSSQTFTSAFDCFNIILMNINEACQHFSLSLVVFIKCWENLWTDCESVKRDPRLWSFVMFDGWCSSVCHLCPKTDLHTAHTELFDVFHVKRFICEI